MTSEDHSQADSFLAPLATAHLVWSPLPLLAALFLATCPPLPPASTGLVSPAIAWLTWMAAIIYLVAAAAFHGRMALVIRRSPHKLSPRDAWLAATQLVLTAIAAWCFFGGPQNAANLAGLGTTVAVALVVSVLSLLLVVTTRMVSSRSTLATAPSRDAATWWLSLLVALVSLTTAVTLLVVQTSPAAASISHATAAEIQAPPRR